MQPRPSFPRESLSPRKRGAGTGLHGNGSMNVASHSNERCEGATAPAVEDCEEPKATRQPPAPYRHSRDRGNPGAAWGGLSNACLTTALLLTLCLCAATSPASAGPASEQESLTPLLPPDGALPGWKRSAPTEFYGPDTLWDCINGAAGLYLDYGFRSLAAQYYASQDPKGTTQVEIYRMESPLHAFAIYAAERSPKEAFLKIGVEGYLADQVLNFWKGPYYVKVSSYRAGEQSKGILKNLAGAVADRIPGQYTEPEALRLFPSENRVARSERYIPKNFLGLTFLAGGYRVDYRTDKSDYQLFLVPAGSPDEAEDAFRAYGKHLESQGDTVSLDDQAPYPFVRTTSGRQTLFRFDAYVGGVLGETDAAHARCLADELVTRLKSFVPVEERQPSLE